ncbi:MAG: response regulator, partial [Candidatus Competibacteraceae bacterium]|nr:response regulator [Candidatus Competibacteraceae bacterium]
EIETEAQILFRYEEGKGSQEDFDPLELDRFSELQQLSRSLIEIVDDLANIQTALDDQTQEMGFLLDQQAKVNKEVQQGLMRTRMVRFSSAAPRLRRVVRQVAQELGKKAELIFEGSEAEIDRAVLDNMVAPLEHMLRNSISHGIEDPQQRLAQGKPEAGSIVLTIRREGAELVLDLQDDGAGLNYDVIRAKGESQGLLKPGQPTSEDELIALLLRPGFSTATKVTQISGRGVGMDVLNNAIKAMRGALLIQSKRGQGTNFMIRLPFSLAITQALLIKAGDDIYAVPLLSINSVARLGEAQYKDYLEGRSAEYEYRGHDYPVHSLGILFGVESAATSFDKAEDKRPPVLMFRSAEASAALQVDAVLGNQEVIVKPVGPQFQALNGISGATVLGDGRVVIVLELAALVRNLTSQSHKQEEARALSMARQEATRRELIKVLVIDDSITMRKVTARFLERHNLSVATAKDGVDALAKLEEQVPDLVILDIEMPRMDGFEVAAHIRNQTHLHHIPIIMVTSRGGEKHRARAAKLGVNDYLTKPYQEEQMIQSIRRILDKQGSDWSISDLAIS